MGAAESLPERDQCRRTGEATALALRFGVKIGAIAQRTMD